MSNKFGQVLRELRTERSLSIRKLAKAVGIDATCISRWERQITVPNADQLIIFAKFFDVTIDYLVGLQDI